MTTPFRHGDDAPSMRLPARFRTMRSEPQAGVRNMAVDLALLGRARATGEAVWRCYSWSQPTVSFGRNETVRHRFDANSLSRAGLDAVRRPTGGRALLHSREVTYSVTLPIADALPWRAAYAAVNAVLLRALQRLGVEAMLVSEAQSEPVRPNGPLCFDRPAAGEIMVDGAKLVGSAVWRERGAYLQHGSILLHDDQSLLATAMIAPLTDIPPREAPPRQAPPPQAPPPAASLNTWFAARQLTPPTWSDVAHALDHTLAEQSDVTSLQFDASLLAQAERIEGDLAKTEWLWRR